MLPNVPEQQEDYIAQAEDVVDEPEASHAEEPGPEGFPGGPQDTSLLISFADHIATKLWQGEVPN